MANSCRGCSKADNCDWTADLRQFVDIDVALINNASKQTKELRSDKKEEIIKKTSALRNSGGGVLFIHIKRLDIRNRNLHFFNELVDERLDGLIEDGSLFSSNFHKVWAVDEYDETFPEAHEFLLLFVKPCRVISTYDFKLKVATDERIQSPSLRNVFHMLHRDQNSVEHPRNQPSPGYLKFEESRSIQLKGFRNNQFVDKINSDNLNELAEFIWKTLRLREYITSLATVSGGGSYYLGVEEDIRNDLGYKAKINFPVGLSIHNSLLKPLQDILLKKILDNILVEPSAPVGELVQIKFHNVIPYVQHYVLQVEVKQVPGCVFYDKKGPEAFRIFNNNLTQVSFKRWLQKLKDLKV